MYAHGTIEKTKPKAFVIDYGQCFSAHVSVVCSFQYSGNRPVPCPFSDAWASDRQAVREKFFTNTKTASRSGTIVVMAFSAAILGYAFYARWTPSGSAAMIAGKFGCTFFNA